MVFGGTARAMGTLAVCVAALLVAGVLAAATVKPPDRAVSIAAGGQVGAAGLGQEGVADTQVPAPAPSVAIAPTVTAAPPTVAPAKPAVTPTTRATATTTATTVVTPTGGTTQPVLPPIPWPSVPPATGIPNMPTASSWQGDSAGVSVRMRLDPVAPVAGQPVTFRLEFSSAGPCCTVFLDYGDGAGWSLNPSYVCGQPSPLTPGSHTAAPIHTYAKAGAFKGHLTVMSWDPCSAPPIPPGGAPVLPEIHDDSFDACIGVGPGTAKDAGCSPFPPYGPDDIVSPIMDPFCQIRSDCTQASKPR